MRFIQKLRKKRGRDLAADLVTGFLVLGCVLFGAGLLWISTLDIPDLSSFDERRVLQSTKIYDRTGEILLYDLHQDVRRTIVPYESISRHIKNATVAIEDDTFFEHWGVRPLAILRSMWSNVLSGGSPFSGAGGSTITQQVIKNSILEPEKTLTRKIKEAILAVRLEQVLTKDEILGYYLNESPYGGTIYGVAEASQAFFGKSPADVTLAEAAYLASLPQLPTYYSPYGSHRDELDARKDLVLERMLLNGFITKEEYDDARAEVVAFLPQVATGIRAPHFVFYIRDYLAEKYGEEALAERGFKVITTLDWDLQEAAEEIVNQKAHENETKFNASNAALVALDPTTGQVLTMVGSRDYFDEEIDGNFNVALAERQPGSAFKPFVYAEAFRRGYTPETAVFDLETQFSTTCAPNVFTSEGGCYSPHNYDNQFRGPVSLRNALAQSLNIPAVKVLYLAGIAPSIRLARDLGITTLTNPDQYGLTLVLGGGEVRLIDMVGAYSVFANEGVKNTPVGVLRIEDSEGNTIEEFSPTPQPVLDREVALQISSVLSDNTARTPLYGANSPLYFGGDAVAAKTGTTNDKRDAWVLGYTTHLAVGAWAGNNDNSSMNELSGLIITPLWRAFMDIALEKYPADTFPEPPTPNPDEKPILSGIWFDPSGLISEKNSRRGVPSISVEDTIASAHSILYYINKNDPTGPSPKNPAQDPQFVLWEYPVSVWKSQLLTNTASGNE
ncbi:transglycosylase domain-containing protein [Candidatus Kaiserbacteria bacterium]|nr:transglycosylase domain-containing protein [Candidatus Kaiserbacteria bacterium]